MSRVVPGRKGFSLRVVGEDLEYDDPEQVSFFDYDGLQAVLEYRQPISPHSWLELSYERERQNQFRDVFLQEKSDTMLVGLRGQLGRGNPIVVRLGYEDLRLDGSAGTDFTGLVGNGSWRVALGSHSAITVGLGRRALPSFFDTYYLNNRVTLQFERRWLGDSAVGLRLNASENRYADPVDWDNMCRTTPPEECEFAFIRRDDLWRAELYFLLALDEKLGFRFSAIRRTRDSNHARSEYESTVLTGGVVVGWFR